MVAGWPPLSSLILVPMCAALVCLGPWFSKERDTGARMCKLWALFASALTLVILIAIAKAGSAVPGTVLRVEETRTWIPSLGISYHLTLDGLSFAFTLLTAVISLAVIAWSGKPAAAGAGWYASLLSAEGAVVGAFLATDLVLFYCFYELMLLPILGAMALWGGSRRLQASLKFLLYTMVGSVFMFLAILYLGYRGMGIMQAHAGLRSFAFEITTLASLPRLSLNEQIVLGLCFLVAFGVKIPAVPLHGWLADTYREAPYGVAAFTAALLGKVGVYAIIRFVWPLFPDCMEVAGPWIAALGAVGVVYGALLAIAQKDVRSLLAYSSLSHLGFCVLGIASASQIAVSGSVFQAVSHGVVTAALFLVFGALIDREGVGEFDKLGGLAKKLPVTAFFLMVFSIAAVALPLTSSFVGEFLIIMGSWASFPEWTLVALGGVVLGAVYTLTAYLKTMFGPVRDTVPLRRSDIRGGDAIVLSAIVAVVIVLGIFPGRLLSIVDAAISTQFQTLQQDGRASGGSRLFSGTSGTTPRAQTIQFDAGGDAQRAVHVVGN